MSTLNKLYIGLVISFTIAFAAILFAQAGPIPTIIVSGSMLVGTALWARTTIKYPTDPAKILPIYLLTVVMLMFHIGEEYAFGFGARIGQITGTGWSQAQFVTMFVFALPFVWIFTGFLIYHRHPLGGFVSWFVFVGMFAGEPTHLAVFPLVEGGRYHYFPGMWTALLPMVMGIWGIAVVMRQYRVDVAREGQIA